mgnify:CR=1 FL=1
MEMNGTVKWFDVRKGFGWNGLFCAFLRDSGRRV